ncbi:tumor necrosis factor receptor superfamily member 9 isoform X3 [Loxodonta africana]|uniref:tumor necrosis factor receptor superfamily member 9 isoform X3 n=1 Tax=Loxodonta africana TaxID=9785 RepID=UPI000C81328B|nr:tumor necrosis factor receptor superfamily member 9 isoform X3 [Loxodonta africana]
MQDFIMGNGYYNMVATVLLVMNFERTGAVQDSCRDCLAGGAYVLLNMCSYRLPFLGTYCVKNESQICSPCPLNSFSSTGGQMNCDMCRKCEGVFKTKRACSPTRDAECECVSGFHCLGAGCTMCQQDCKQGQELTKEGCKDCCLGTFNDQKNGICRPWTNCSLEGKSVLANGTKKRDVVCGPPAADSFPDTSSVTVPAPERKPDHHPQIITFFLALISAALLFLVFFLVVRFSVAKWGRKKLLYIFKQPFIKPVQTAQEEDGCSCRFPEEEEGDCEL